MISHFLFCWPKRWKIIRQGILTRRGNPIGHWYNLQCEKCGYLKGKTIIGKRMYE